MSDRSGQPDNDHWKTPQWLYDKLNAEFNFDFDPCPIYADFDGLAIEWGNCNFINPPYNKRDKPLFIQKAYDEWRKGKTCVLLIPTATSTKQFHELILPHAEIRFLKGRISFVPAALPRYASQKMIKEHNDALTKIDNKQRSIIGKHDSMIVIFKGKRKND